MHHYRLKFGYQGSPPPPLYIEGLLRELGFVNFSQLERRDASTWALSSSLIEALVAGLLSTSIQEDGNYFSGRLTSVAVTAAVSSC